MDREVLEMLLDKIMGLQERIVELKHNHRQEHKRLNDNYTDALTKLRDASEQNYSLRKTVTLLEDQLDELNSAGSKFHVTLDVRGGNKIQAIKHVREVTGLGLKEAKDLVEASAEKPMKIGVFSERKAERLVSGLREVGADAWMAAVDDETTKPQPDDVEVADSATATEPVQ